MSGKKVLLIEPYYGGSHKQFLQGIIKYIDADFLLLHLPARKWKMRMQLSAPWFVNKIKAIPERERWFDTVLMSTFIDVAVFRTLVSQIPGWNPDIQFCTYFHENQFSYPGLLAKTTMHQFTAINFTTALASDRLAFNSIYNRNSFLQQCGVYLSKAADMKFSNELDHIKNKSIVLYPGLDFESLDSLPTEKNKAETPLIIWNHRWEHDKNPEALFQVLFKLDQERVPFRLALLGQGFRNRPAIFKEAEKRLAPVIDHFGFVEDKTTYFKILKSGSFILSTSIHEFFGISMLEGVRAGCLPLVPDRLSYQELFDKRFRYGDGELYDALKKNLTHRCTLQPTECVEMTERYSWPVLAPEYLRWLECGEKKSASCVPDANRIV